MTLEQCLCEASTISSKLSALINATAKIVSCGPSRCVNYSCSCPRSPNASIETPAPWQTNVTGNVTLNFTETPAPWKPSPILLEIIYEGENILSISAVQAAARRAATATGHFVTTLSSLDEWDPAKIFGETSESPALLVGIVAACLAVVARIAFYFTGKTIVTTSARLIDIKLL